MSSRRVVAFALVALLAGASLAHAAADEGELLRQIKSAVFDQQWKDVLDNCDEFISRFGRSEALPRAYYYRAQALEHIPGREGDAIVGYGEFLEKFPSESGALKEDAILSRITLATSLYLKGNKGHLRVITDGMNLSGYPRIYAAIQASKIDHRPARQKALPILEECARNERDTELRNECVVGILRIDPTKVPAESGRPVERKVAPGDTREVKLIRVEVYDKTKKQVVVRVNLPIAFADLVLDSLSDMWRHKLEEELWPNGKEIDFQKFWDAIKQGGAQTLVEVDEGDQTIKVWVE